MKNEFLKASSMDENQPSILMVTHGKVIQLLFKIFFEEMDCVANIPGVSNPADLLIIRNFMTACSNTCWSRFEIEISVEDKNRIKKIECHELFKKDHLNNLV